MLRAGSFVLAVLSHLHQLVDGVQQAVAVLPEQPLVEPLVSEAHFQQHRHHGRVLSGGRVNTSLEGRGKEGDEIRGGGAGYLVDNMKFSAGLSAQAAQLKRWI